MNHRFPHARRGALLVVVVGLVSVVMALSLAFLARMRSDGEEGMRFAQDIQAHVMLSSALMYVQETSRLGWDNAAEIAAGRKVPGDETYGWRDVRDGMPGPRLFDGTWPTTSAFDGIRADGTVPAGHTPAAAFPAIGGRAARCPMYRMRRPPYAIKNIVAPNPIPFSAPSDVDTRAWSKIINFKNKDPEPDAANWADFKAGDTTPVDNDSQPAWFRVYRSGPITFVLTCGAGASRGWKTYDDAVAAGDDSWGSRAAFDEVRRNETILWYEAAWSDIVTGNNFLHLHYSRWGQRFIGSPQPNGDEVPNLRQQGGTFSYIRRLPDFPTTTDW